MDRSLREHIASLERLIETLSVEMMSAGDLGKRNRLEAEIRAACTALEHYRTALEIETRLAVR